MVNKYKQAFQKIETAKNILLVTHVHPDGDAAGSICSLINLMENLNKQYTAFCKNDLSDFSFLPLSEKLTTDKDNLNISDFDLIIILDCGSLSRTDLYDEIINRDKTQTVIEFDHHPKIENFAEIEIRRPGMSSTAEVLYHLFKTNGIKINKNIANCILTGILTDTANFLYPSTTDETVNIASEMLIYGASFQNIVKQTWQNKSLGAMKVWGVALNNLKINEKYNIAFSVLTDDDLSVLGDDEDKVLNDVANFLSNLHGVKATLFLRQDEDNIIKGNLRTSQADVDVSKLARTLGGGGHTKASGFVVNGQIIKGDETWKII